MKHRTAIFIALLFHCASNLFSQALTVSSQQLNFGTAFENAPDSLQLAITNTLSRNVSVNGIVFYNTYGLPAFSARERNFTIAASASKTIWIKFSPRHNILHNSEMVIVNDGLRGYLSVDLTGQGSYSNAYYDLSENQSEEDLKSALHTLTGVGYVVLGYNVARDNMFMTIDNKKVNGQGAAQNTIECIYTGREAVGYTDRADCQTNFSFNTEHTFPQTYFNSLEPMKSDLHHLFPTDDLANNARGDNPFGIVTGGTTWAVGGSKATNSLFEPRDEQKGVAARAMMYFVLRYQNYSGFFTPQETLLRSWNLNFPAYAAEGQRNDAIDAVQHNRNPFVDYPQFIERITSISATSIAPVVRSVDLPQDTIIYGYVPLGVPTDFHYVIVNKGNAEVQLLNFSLSNQELTFQSGGVNTTLAAGEALAVDIRLITQSNSSLHAFLNFNTNDPAHQAVSIPVYANDSVFDNVEELDEGRLSISPNPAHENLTIKSEGMNVTGLGVYDATGRIVIELQNLSGDTQVLQVNELLAGVYILKIGFGGNIVFRKFMKE